MYTQLNKAIGTIKDSPATVTNTSSASATNDSTKTETKETTYGWVTAHMDKYKLSYQFHQGTSMRDIVLLHSDSTDTVFCNEKYVSNIRDA